MAGGECDRTKYIVEDLYKNKKDLDIKSRKAGYKNYADFFRQVARKFLNDEVIIVPSGYEVVIRKISN